MGLLTSSVKKSFIKNRMYVPPWMAAAQWAALSLIPIVLIIAYFFGEDVSDLPVAQESSATQQEIVINGADDFEISTTTPVEPPAGTGDLASTIEINDVDGLAVTIPEQALSVAEAAGQAFWRNDWSGIPVNGPTPLLPESYSAAVVSDPLIYAQTQDSITFLMKVDLDNDSVIDQSFQIKVIDTSEGWEYSS